MALSGTDLINDFDMHFDGSDMTNASLYLCADSNLTDSDIETLITALRNGGLWSGDAAKTVPAEHKPMYAEQMEFIGHVSGKVNGKLFYVCAYNHEKFPYQPSRWAEWKNFIAENYPA